MPRLDAAQKKKVVSCTKLLSHFFFPYVIRFSATSMLQLPIIAFNSPKRGLPSKITQFRLILKRSSFSFSDFRHTQPVSKCEEVCVCVVVGGQGHALLCSLNIRFFPWLARIQISPRSSFLPAMIAGGEKEKEIMLGFCFPFFFFLLPADLINLMHLSCRQKKKKFFSLPSSVLLPLSL